MSIRLEKGQRINLEKEGGQELRQFCVGCNWGAIPTRRKGFLGIGSKTEHRDVDLDLSCVMLDERGKLLDHIYSPEYRGDFLASYGMPAGKLVSACGALRHSGDDRKGDQSGDDGLDNEILTVNLDRIDPRAEQVFFFLNNVGPEDFAQIPYASIRMYEGTPEKVKEIFANYDVSAMPDYSGKRALVMGRLYKRDGKWRFAAIGEATNDGNICETIRGICSKYGKGV